MLKSFTITAFLFVSVSLDAQLARVCVSSGVPKKSNGCASSAPLVAQDSATFINGGTAFIANGSTYCSDKSFYIYVPYSGVMNDPLNDILTPCIKTDFSPYWTTLRTYGEETYYEGSNSIFCIGPSGCAMPIGGFSPPTSGIGAFDMYLSAMDSTASHTMVFSKLAGTWNTTTVTVQNCWDNSPIVSTVATPFVWSGGINSFTVSLAPGAPIGSAVFTVAPPATGALTDFHNGYCYIRPDSLQPGITYTVTYHFSHSMCSNIQGTFSFTRGDSTPNILVNSPSICVGDSAWLVGTGGVSYTWSPGSVINDSLLVHPATTTSYNLLASGGCGVNAAVSSLVTINNCTSIIESNHLIGQRIWPNPTRGQLHVQSATNETCIRVELLDMLGVKIEDEVICKDGSEQVFNVRLNHASGIYTLIVYSSLERQVYRLIIE